MYHFEEGIERRNTNCDKWDAPFVGQDVIPMWVADMDFAIAPAITERLVKVADQGAFGYQFLSDTYYDAVRCFMKERHNYEVKKEWICFVPNVVLGLFFALQTVTEEGDEILIQTPVYGPFFKVINESNRVLVESRLRNVNGYYTMDMEDLEKRITPKTKALLLCNPHNPSGRVWKKEELRELVKICAKHDICIISDDIHSDIIRKGQQHTMIVPICREMGVKCISCTSPSKPFNLASIHVANCIIEDDEIREKFQKLLQIHHMTECSAFAEAALVGAYNESRDWLDEVNKYIDENVEYFVNTVHEKLPFLHVCKPEGTYLIWVDFSDTTLQQDKIKEYLHEKCKVLVNPGEFFGEAGKGFVRFNVACPRKNIEEALDRICRNLIQ